MIANFSYHKLPMVKDLEACEPQLIAHDLVARDRGRRSPARRGVAQRDQAVGWNPALPDLQPPADEYLVVDADGSQSYAINARARGQQPGREGPARHRQEPDDREPHRHPRGPPPTGAVRGREAGRDRRGAEAARRRGPRPPRDGPPPPSAVAAPLAQDLQAALDASASTPAVDLAAQQAALVNRRERLNRYTSALHRPRDPWGESLFTVLRALPEIDAAARIAYRFPAAALTQLDRERAGEASPGPPRPRRPRRRAPTRRALGRQRHAVTRRRPRRARRRHHPQGGVAPRGGRW